MSLPFAAEILLAAQDIRLAFFDVDGVLTDGGVYFSEGGETLKRFSILDGYGLKLLRTAGITPAVITGRDSKPLRVRLEALGIEHVRYGTEDKLPAAQAMLEQLGFGWAEAAAIGDDWPDLPVLQRVGFAAAPANAHAEVRRAVRYVTQARGGEGAAREFCDLLLTAGGHYRRLLDRARGAPE
jgi:3-deoxy-D-manno-octulosonate 8-phosphate phosphatase (KDO 8-P phosphatase)